MTSELRGGAERATRGWRGDVPAREHPPFGGWTRPGLRL